MSSQKLLKVSNLEVSFPVNGQETAAVRGVSFDLQAGETLGLVGESGCGKSVTSLAILGLIAKPGRISGGSVKYRDQELVGLSDQSLREIRGNKISMIFQEPMTSLNPVFTVGDQIAEVLITHKKISKKAALKEAVRFLDLVGIPSASRRIHDYPHQLSGGMRQRVMIAMALVCQPEVLIADEPTTALDVTVQAQILKLLKSLQQELGLAILLITHDMGVVNDQCDRVIMMYGGEVIEQLQTEKLFTGARHPYTYSLIRSTPRIGKRSEELFSIPGQVPRLGHYPKGCYFAPRCFNRIEKCVCDHPTLEKIEVEDHSVRCFHQVGN